MLPKSCSYWTTTDTESLFSVCNKQTTLTRLTYTLEKNYKLMLKKTSPSKWCDGTLPHYGHLVVCIDRISKQCSLPCLLRSVNLFYMPALTASGKQAVVFIYIYSCESTDTEWLLSRVIPEDEELQVRSVSLLHRLTALVSDTQPKPTPPPPVTAHCVALHACRERMMNGWL